MNKNKFLTFILTVFIVSSAVRAQFADGSPVLTAEKISSNATQLSGAKNVLFSPSGKWMIVQADVGFHVVPTEKIGELEEGFKDSRFPYFEGWANGFLPSGKAVFTARRELFAIDPATNKTQLIYHITAAEEEDGDYLIDGAKVIVSENLIVSGDGNADAAMKKSSVIRFDLKRRTATRAEAIRGFHHPLLSPDGKYLLYRTNHKNDSTAAIYDIARDKNRSLAARFGFKRVFPDYKRTFERPIAWISPTRFLAEIIEDQNNPAVNYKNDPQPWLVLFDVSGKIIWKREMLFESFPEYFHQLSAAKALIENDGGVYEINLRNGKTKIVLQNLDDLDIKAVAVSPDKKQIAYFDTQKHLFLTTINGENKKLLADLPYDWVGVWMHQETALRPPLWSPDGKRLFVFDTDRLLIVEIEKIDVYRQ